VAGLCNKDPAWLVTITYPMQIKGSLFRVLGEFPTQSKESNLELQILPGMATQLNCATNPRTET